MSDSMVRFNLEKHRDRKEVAKLAFNNIKTITLDTIRHLILVLNRTVTKVHRTWYKNWYGFLPSMSWPACHKVWKKNPSCPPYNYLRFSLSG